jgi:hypothetical protein
MALTIEPRTGIMFQARHPIPFKHMLFLVYVLETMHIKMHTTQFQVQF